MKKFYMLLSFAFLLGCETPYYIYHSTASIPYSIYETKTDMTLILDKEFKLNNTAICVAKDFDNVKKKEIYYLLLCPSRENATEINKLEDLNLELGVPVKPNIASQMIKSLNNVVDMWENPKIKESGTFYEFYATPEHESWKVSDSVIVSNPLIRLNFQNLASGTVGTIYFGEDNYRRGYWIGSKTSLQNIIKNIELGIQELKKMGYKE